MKFRLLLISIFFTTAAFSQSKSDLKSEITEVNKNYIQLVVKLEKLENLINILTASLKESQLKIESLVQNDVRLQTQIDLLIQKNGQLINQVSNQNKSDDKFLNSKNTSNDQFNTDNSTQRKSSSQGSSQISYGQCRATTKKGTRCSRNATASGYCWQH